VKVCLISFPRTSDLLRVHYVSSYVCVIILYELPFPYLITYLITTIPLNLRITGPLSSQAGLDLRKKETYNSLLEHNFLPTGCIDALQETKTTCLFNMFT